jgi:pimeloyl-ACP methyl ester carboxylesterase
MEELSLALPSGRLQAVVHGPADGPLVLCLHGLTANARAFDVIGERLASTGRRAVAPDLRGRGLSDITPPGSYGLGSHAADAIAAANELGAETFDVVGWSMGALTGILAASLAAGRLRRLVLVDHAGRMDHTAVDAIIAGLDRLAAVVDDPQEYVDRIRSAGGIERWVDQWDAVYRRELHHAEDGHWVPRTSRAAAEEDLADILARDWTEAWRPLAMPTLLVRATRPINGGFIVPERERDALVARAAQPTVVEVDANHFDVMTADDTASAIVDHLS